MNKSIRIIGIPTDLGQSHRGVDVGPSAVRYAGLSDRLRRLGYRIEDAGNIHVPVRAALDQEELLPAVRQACESAYQAAREALADHCSPIFLGGDHSIAMGSVGGVSHESPAGVIWVDAHGDFNTPQTSRTGNLHGMALSVLLGQGFPELVHIGRNGAKLKPENVVLIGVRELDPEERAMLRQSGITVFTMRDVDEQGISNITHKTIARLRHLRRIHVSLDMDSLDPTDAPGVGTPVPGGLTYREAHLLMEIIADLRFPVSMDIVEINPIMDLRNHTGEIAVDLAVSLFGKTIL